MAFWELSGYEIDGAADKANIDGFSLIPDNTVATAMIKKIEVREFGEDPWFYNVTYKIVDGQYKNRETWQKLKVNEDNMDKRVRALNMLMRLYKLTETTLPHDEPSQAELNALCNKPLDIRIMQWARDGREGNWISEVQAMGELIKKEAEKASSNPDHAPLESALNRNAQRSDAKASGNSSGDNSFSDDIPF